MNMPFRQNHQRAGDQRVPDPADPAPRRAPPTTTEVIDSQQGLARLAAGPGADRIADALTGCFLPILESGGFPAGLLPFGSDGVGLAGAITLPGAIVRAVPEGRV